MNVSDVRTMAPVNPEDRKRNARRAALWLALLALAFYAGFILLGVLRSRS